MWRKRSTQSRTGTSNISTCFVSIRGIARYGLGDRMKENISTFVQNNSFYHLAIKLFRQFTEVMHHCAIETLVATPI